MKKNSYKKGLSDIRPWGTWEVIDARENICIKKITVKPKQCLSLQMHNYRNEHWIIIQGTAVVTNGDETFELKTGEATFIPLKNKHRIKNEQDHNMVFIEVQTGSILNEDDIIRFEDIYGRN